MPTPQQFGPYRVVREVARGGMGVVYEVVHVETGGQFALKAILSEVADVAELLRFQREAEVLARLAHPNVVRIHTANFEHRPPYFVQEFLRGGSLADRLRGGPLPAIEAAAATAKLATGLHAAHQAGLLHRDLKPGNVLFDENGEPKLADFGLARMTQLDTQGLTQSGSILGTPGFMAPEQALDPRKLDVRADVYGLGAVLYAMLTGGAPFSGGGVLLVLNRVIHEDPTPPSRLNAEVPPAVEAVCLRALSKAPEQRYDDAAAFAAALESTTHEARGSSSGLKAVGALAISVAVLAGVGVSLFAGSSREPGIPARLERLDLAVAEAFDAGSRERVPPLLGQLAALASDVKTVSERAGLKAIRSRLRLFEALTQVSGGQRTAALATLDELERPESKLLGLALKGTDPDATPAQVQRRLGRLLSSLPGHWPEFEALRDEARSELEADAGWDKALEVFKRRRHSSPMGERMQVALRSIEATGSELQRQFAACDAVYATDRALFAGLDRGARLGAREKQAKGMIRRACVFAAKANPMGPNNRVQSTDRERLLAADRVQQELRLAHFFAPELRVGYGGLEPCVSLYRFSVQGTDGAREVFIKLGLALAELGSNDAKLLNDLAVLSEPHGSIFWRAMRPVYSRAIELQTEESTREALRSRLVANFASTSQTDEERREGVALATRMLKEDDGTDRRVRTSLLVARAGMLGELGEHARALADCREGKKLGLPHPQLFLIRGRSSLALGHVDEACAAMSAFVRHWTGIETPVELAVSVRVLWEHRRDRLDVLRPALKALASVRQDQWAGWRIRYALVELESGRPQLGLKALDQAVEFIPGRSDVRGFEGDVRAARASLAAGRTQEAEEALRTTVKALEALRGDRLRP